MSPNCSLTTNNVPEAIPSDHDTIDSHRIELAGLGRTGRAQLVLPDSFDCEPDDVVQLTLGESRYYAQVESTLGEEPTIRGAFGNRRLAKATEGDDHLREWLAQRGYGPGDTLVLDVVTKGHHYGLREPGNRVVYEATDPPNDSLSDIADSLGE